MSSDVLNISDYDIIKENKCNYLNENIWFSQNENIKFLSLEDIINDHKIFNHKILNNKNFDDKSFYNEKFIDLYYNYNYNIKINNKYDLNNISNEKFKKKIIKNRLSSIKSRNKTNNKIKLLEEKNKYLKQKCFDKNININIEENNIKENNIEENNIKENKKIKKTNKYDINNISNEKLKKKIIKNRLSALKYRNKINNKIKLLEEENNKLRKLINNEIF
jgi:hypothetical protein